MQGSKWPGPVRHPQNSFKSNTAVMSRERIPPAPENIFQKDEGMRPSLRIRTEMDSGKFRLPFSLHEARLRAQLTLRGTKAMELPRRSPVQALPLDRPPLNPVQSGTPSLAVRVRACCVDPVAGAFDLSRMDVAAVKESEIPAVRRIGPFVLQLTLPENLEKLPKWTFSFSDLEVIVIRKFRGSKLELDGFPLLREVRVSGHELGTMILPERSIVRLSPGQLPERGIECIWKMNDDGRVVAKEIRGHPWVDSKETSEYIDAMREDLKNLTKTEDVVPFLRGEISRSGTPCSAFEMLAFANAKALPAYLGLIRAAVDDGKLPVDSIPDVLACKGSPSPLLPGGNAGQQRDQAVQAYEKCLLQLATDGYLSQVGLEDLMKRIKPA